MANLEIIDQIGPHIINDNLRIVKKSFKKGEKIEKHTHEGFNVSFVLAQGKADFEVGDEKKTLEGPVVLNFDGKEPISVEALTDIEVFVFLIG